MKLIFDIQTFWLCGTGQSALGSADQTVNRTDGGLPFIPGKTIKGIVKHALKEWTSLIGEDETADLSERLFGGQPDELAGQKMDQSRGPIKGALRMGSAHLGVAETTFLTVKKNRSLIKGLYQNVASTEIDHATGSAAHHSLRTMEVVVPLRLEAEVSWIEDAKYRHDLPQNWQGILMESLSLIHNIGSNRSRGFGRCVVTMEGEK